MFPCAAVLAGNDFASFAVTAGPCYLLPGSSQENEEGAGAGINEGDTEESREGSPSKKAGGERAGGRRRQEQEVQQGEEEPKAGKSYRGARVRRKKAEEDAAGRIGEGAVKVQDKGYGNQVGGETGGDQRGGSTADKDIPPITSAGGVITIDNDL